MSNPKRPTPEQLRTYKGLEHLTDEQAEALHDQLTQLAAMVLRIYPLPAIEIEAENKTKNNERRIA